MIVNCPLIHLYIQCFSHSFVHSFTKTVQISHGHCLPFFSFHDFISLVALKRIHEIMNGTDIHGKPPSEQTSSHTRWSPYQPPAPTVNTSYLAPNAISISQQQNQTLPTGVSTWTYTSVEVSFRYTMYNVNIYKICHVQISSWYIIQILWKWELWQFYKIHSII